MGPRVQLFKPLVVYMSLTFIFQILKCLTGLPDKFGYLYHAYSATKEDNVFLKIQRVDLIAKC